MWVLVLALVASLGTAGIVVAGVFHHSGRTDGSYTIWKASSPAPEQTDREDRQVTLGTAFTSSVAGTVSAVRYYRAKGDDEAHRARIWNDRGFVVARVTIPGSDQVGWDEAELSTPIKLGAGREYVVSYVADDGDYATSHDALSPEDPTTNQSLTASRGVFTYGSDMPSRTWRDSSYFVDVRFLPSDDSEGPAPSLPPVPTDPPGSTSPSAQPSPTTPAPSPTSTSPGEDPTSTPSGTPSPTSPSSPPVTPSEFPAAGNTGVPSGVALTPYTGPLTITRAGTVIDAKTIDGDVLIKADDVKITNSKINGRVSSDFNGSVSIAYSNIDGGNQETFPSVSYSDITLDHVEVVGGQHSVQCSENCTITNSWLHDQYLPSGSAGHVNAFISNGGNNLVLRHNTVHCTVPLTRNDGGCSGDVSLFGDFDPISNVTIDNNYFRANQESISYCLYAGYNPSKPYGSNPSNVRVTNNVFERGANNKCGVYGPVTSFLPGNGNVWSNNTWQGSSTLIASAK